MNRIARGLAAFIAVSLGVPSASAAMGQQGDAEHVDFGETSNVDEREDDPDLEALIRQATEHFTAGQQLFFEGDYGRAAREFEASYAAIESGDALRNAIVAHARAGQSVPALKSARRYLALPQCGALQSDPLHCSRDVDEIERVQQRLMRQLGELEISIERGVEVAEIQVAGQTVPLEDFPLVLEPGPVEIVVRGFAQDEELVSVLRMRAGERASLYVTPFVTESVRPTPPPVVEDEVVAKPPEDRGRREAPPQRARQLKVGFWVGASMTLALGAGATTTGILTREYQAAFTRGLDDLSRPPPYHLEPVFYRLRTATNVLIGATALMGVTTLALGIWRLRLRSRERTSNTRLELGPGALRARF